MTYSRTSQQASTRFLGRACVIGAAATIALGAVSQAVQAGTTVSSDRLSYPWSSHSAPLFFVLAAASQVLLAGGVLALRRSGVAGTTRTAEIALLAALAGTALITVGDLGMIALRHELTDSGSARIVETVFGIATIASTIAFLVVGATTRRARVWNDWRRFTPLAIGIWSVVLVGLQFTGIAASAIGVYGACFLALGVALGSSEQRAITVGRTDAQPI
jgi:hypothetical protein